MLLLKVIGYILIIGGFIVIAFDCLVLILYLLFFRTKTPLAEVLLGVIGQAGLALLFIWVGRKIKNKAL